MCVFKISDAQKYLIISGMKLQFTDFDGEEINIEIDEIEDSADNTLDDHDSTDAPTTTAVNPNGLDYYNPDIKGNY